MTDIDIITTIGALTAFGFLVLLALVNRLQRQVNRHDEILRATINAAITPVDSPGDFLPPPPPPPQDYFRPVPDETRARATAAHEDDTT